MAFIQLNEIMAHNPEDICINLQKYISDLENKILSIELILNCSEPIENITSYIFEFSDTDIGSFVFHDFFDFEREKFQEYSTYLKFYKKYRKVLGVHSSEFFDKKKKIEKIMALTMASVMDEKIIDFYDKNAADVQTLKNIIKEKKRFPKELF
jgi:hypothetical protein